MPHKKKEWARLLLRVIDPSFYIKNPRDPSDPNCGSISVTFFAKRFEDLPKFKKIGDILRIHRANTGTF